MQLIKKIEINYLRSLYSAVIDKAGDLNVIFGRNDSGKSNLLRALNLFFNESIEIDQPIDFDIDMSDARRREARDAKGRQAIWIKITFNVPDNYKASLGDEIAIKRQWNRDGDQNQTVFSNLEGEVKQARLTRFLNDIDFTYIPAIKDINVYADLIERMYGAASETEVLVRATNQFVDAIAGQTTSLSEQLGKMFGGPAKLAPPTEMSRLFRNLDFAHGVDGHSLLRQKGDGVKARHLPELLRFINANEPRKRLYLWGFEEPENSLDLGAAEIEARRFAGFAGRSDTQVFITSHSPAFYLADGGDCDIRRFFITKQEKSSEGEMEPKNAASLIDKLDDAENRMEHAGLLQLPFVIRRMSEQREALKAKEVEAESLREQLRKLSTPTMFVEGVHDVKAFHAALRKLGAYESISVKPLGGTPQTTEALFSAVLEQGGLNASAPAFFLFDDDKAGRAACRKLCKSAPLAEPLAYSENSKVWTIPKTDEFKLFMRRHSILADQAFFTAEFLYPATEAAALCAELVAERGGSEMDEWKRTINGDYWPSLGQSRCHALASSAEGSVDWFYARGVPVGLKQRFADQAVHRGLSDERFTSAIEKVLESIFSE